MAKLNIFKIHFASIYPLYIRKAEKKGRSKNEYKRNKNYEQI
ncbi:MAG: DUF2200 domain-containing protein [Prevotellaceae bacterium]|nr:DUF2200 domain-containing protein [Prevotellaceae bacterium]